MSTAKAYSGSTSNTSSQTSASSKSRLAQLLTLRNIALMFEVVALFITGYLTYTKLAAQPMQCIQGGMFNCSVLENSAWAQVVVSPSLAIPVAFLGFLCHLFMTVIILFERRIGFLREWGLVILLGTTIFGFLYHSYLTFYVAIYTMRALCPWCLMAHTLMGGLLLIAFLRLRASWKQAESAA